jgi:membrane protein YqaA with SNARE-associated domain
VRKKEFYPTRGDSAISAATASAGEAKQLAEVWYNNVISGELGDMKQVKLPRWLQRFMALMGGGGLFVVAFLDSSVLSFPFVTDILVVQLSIQRPARMPYYAGMAAFGSLCGCIWLYLLAKKGGEVYFHRHGGAAAAHAKRWVQNRAFLSVFIPAILPPPLPFKVFVLAEGVFQVPLRTFVSALLLGRGLRYFAEGILAVRYGEPALLYLVAHSGAFAIGTILVLAILYAATHFFFHRQSQES